MPEHCAAYSCTNRRTVASRAQGITFHRFPKDRNTRKKWEIASRRKKFTASDSTVLCSEHFEEQDFDRTGQVVRLRDGVIPSVFNFPDQPQRPKKSRNTSASRKSEVSLSKTPQDDPAASTSQSDPQPKDPEKNRNTSASRRSEESLSKTPQVAPAASTSHSEPRPKDDHSYVMPSSPSALKARLTGALERLDILEREKKNAKAREKRAKINMETLLAQLSEQNLVNEELKERLEFYSGKMKKKKKAKTVL